MRIKGEKEPAVSNGMAQTCEANSSQNTEELLYLQFSVRRVEQNENYTPTPSEVLKSTQEDCCTFELVEFNHPETRPYDVVNSITETLCFRGNVVSASNCFLVSVAPKLSSLSCELCASHLVKPFRKIIFGPFSGHKLQNLGDCDLIGCLHSARMVSTSMYMH